jgi:hypothetical protein
MGRVIGLVSAVVIGLLALPALASAADRNHDKLPDKWEKHFHLSLSVKQANRDQDHDGLRNMGEFRAGDNPRRADSNHDGTEDGDDNAGTISAIDGNSVTIDLFNGGSVTGLVTDQTEIECEQAEDESGDDSAARDHGGNSGPGGGENSGNPGENEGEEPNGENNQCTIADLAVGQVVAEAELSLQNGDATFEEIDLTGTHDSNASSTSS